MSTPGLDSAISGWRAHHEAMREQARAIAAQRAKEADTRAGATLSAGPTKVPFTDPRQDEGVSDAN